MRSRGFQRVRVGEFLGLSAVKGCADGRDREEGDAGQPPVSEEERQAWFRSMWEGGKEGAPADKEEEVEAEEADDEKTNDDDDDFGDDFDDFAEGQEGGDDDDFGDFDETPMAAEPTPQQQPQQPQLPDALAGLVSSCTYPDHSIPNNSINTKRQKVS